MELLEVALIKDLAELNDKRAVDPLYDLTKNGTILTPFAVRDALRSLEDVKKAELIETALRELKNKVSGHDYEKIIISPTFGNVLSFVEEGIVFDVTNTGGGTREAEIVDWEPTSYWHGTNLVEEVISIDEYGGWHRGYWGGSVEVENPDNWVVTSPEKIEIVKGNKFEANSAVLPVAFLGAISTNYFSAFNGSILAAASFTNLKEGLPGLIIMFGFVVALGVFNFFAMEDGFDKIKKSRIWPPTLKWARNFLDYGYHGGSNDIKKAIRALYIIGNHLKSNDADAERLQKAIESSPGILEELKDTRAIKPLLMVLSKNASAEIEITSKKLGATNEKLVDAYIQALGSYKSSVVELASKRLGELGDSRAIDPLFNAFFAETLPETEVALRKLGINSDMIFRYIRLLRLSDSSTVDTAIQELGKLGNVKTVGLLISLVQQSANILVADALWNIGVKNPEAGIIESGRISAKIMKRIKEGLNDERPSAPNKPIEPSAPRYDGYNPDLAGGGGGRDRGAEEKYHVELEEYEEEMKAYPEKMKEFEVWAREWDAKAALLIQKLESLRTTGQQTNASVTADNDVGGIDMNNIELDRQGQGEGILFDMTGMEPLLNMDIQGFSPVIIDIVPINSMLPILGLADPTEKGTKFGEEEVQENLQLSQVDS